MSNLQPAVHRFFFLLLFLSFENPYKEQFFVLKSKKQARFMAKLSAKEFFFIFFLFVFTYYLSTEFLFFFIHLTHTHFHLSAGIHSPRTPPQLYFARLKQFVESPNFFQPFYPFFLNFFFHFFMAILYPSKSELKNLRKKHFYPFTFLYWFFFIFFLKNRIQFIFFWSCNKYLNKSV